MPAVTKFSTLLDNAARDCWLALNEDETKIVGRGDTAVEALEEAKRNGATDPVLILAPKMWTPAIYL